MESSGAPGTPPDGAGQPAAAPPPPAAPLPAAAPPGPPPAAPPAASATPGWVGAITSQQTIAGAGGLTYADVPSRIFAYIVDAIIMAVAFGILWAIFGVLFIGSALGGFDILTFVWFVVLLFLYAAFSAVYFIYTWTKMRGSPGMRVLGLQVLNAADGAALTQPQAIRRWLFLFGPFVLGQVAAFMLGGMGTILSLVLFGYLIYLLYTAANSPTRQGFHDVQAATVVVKVGQ
jgi:uncharacterized RDD family membrane protein YckC